MKIAVIYNRESRKVINLFGIPSREKYGQKNIARIVDSLKKGGHSVQAFEGDKNLVQTLESFMPRVLKGERPGMVFNLSYGIQGNARYTHVPGILEMVGMPYVGSDPLAHSLCLDKVVSKMLFRQNGLPTPDFAVLTEEGFDAPDLAYPLIVKPKNESTSFGLKVVDNEADLREAAGVILREFGQAVLCEQYIAGREINVGLLGNGPPDAFPPAELVFGEVGMPIYTLDDKMGKSGREVRVQCPADLDEATTLRAQQISQKAFQVLGCADCARVDLRMDGEGNLFILEINSLPSLGERGSFSAGAGAAGLDFTALVNRLVETASARYFGTPHPPRISSRGTDPRDLTFAFITERRDRIERRLHRWADVSSRTQDPIGIQAALSKLDRRLGEAGLKPAPQNGLERVARLYETDAGFVNGTLLVAHADVPLPRSALSPVFRREPEWLTGEGVGVSRAPLTMIEFALKALRAQKVLKRLPLGVAVYCDEGEDGRFSRETLRSWFEKARRILFVRPGTTTGRLVVGRRGFRRYRLAVEAPPRRLGQTGKGVEVLTWLCEKVPAIGQIAPRRGRATISITDLETRAFPTLLPHQVSATLGMSYSDTTSADQMEGALRDLLSGKGPGWALECLIDRPPMLKKKNNEDLARVFARVAAYWDIPIEWETSSMPSAAGLAPADTPVLCGLGPQATNLHTPQENVQRIGLVQRTLALSQFLMETL